MNICQNWIHKYFIFLKIFQQVNGDGLSLALSADLDSLKADLLREMRLEIQKAKQEIIDGIYFFYSIIF